MFFEQLISAKDLQVENQTTIFRITIPKCYELLDFENMLLQLTKDILI